ncbi:MAG TPA: hypothetical protein VN088_16565 [Nocardioides sp.]|nr:hypothetical protein [Nocardioides sp.]
MTNRSSVGSGALVLAALLLASVLSSCSGHDGTTSSATKVCGIIDPALVTGYVGTSDYTWNGRPDGSTFGSECTVLRSGRSVLLASVLRFQDGAEASEQIAKVRSSRASMRTSCPKPRFFDDWATGNACIRSEGSISMVIATRSYSLQLTFDSPATPITLGEAETIAQDITTNMASNTASNTASVAAS